MSFNNCTYCNRQLLRDEWTYNDIEIYKFCDEKCMLAWKDNDQKPMSVSFEQCAHCAHEHLSPEMIIASKHWFCDSKCFKSFNYEPVNMIGFDPARRCTYCDRFKSIKEMEFCNNRYFCDSGCKIRFTAIEIEPKRNAINPIHYRSHKSGIECIQVTEHMSFTLGNAMKYIWRADLKNGIEDLEKAKWYLEREINKRSNEINKRSIGNGKESK